MCTVPRLALLLFVVCLDAAPVRAQVTVSGEATAIGESGGEVEADFTIR